MGSGDSRIARLGDVDFRGKVGANVAAYAKANQALARDFAAELDDAAARSERAMRKLKGHPLLLGVDVRLRARRMAGELRKAKELALAVSAESVKFNRQYRKEFVELDQKANKGKGKKRWSGEVDL